MSTDQNTTPPTAGVLIIGNEILSGRTQDTNLHSIAQKLSGMGIHLREAIIIPDQAELIINTLNRLRQLYNYVFTTGGLGPTHDDITAASIARAFNRLLIENSAARERLLAYYGVENLTPARLRMAQMPENAILIANPVSGAPGFQVENVFALAGVPTIMQAMLDSCTAKLAHGAAFHSITLTGAVPESVLAADLAAIAAAYPLCDIGSYPWFRSGNFGLAVVVRGTDKSMLLRAAHAVYALMLTRDAQAAMKNDDSNA